MDAHAMTPSKTEQQQNRLDTLSTVSRILSEALLKLGDAFPQGHSTITWKEYQADVARHTALHTQFEALIDAVHDSLSHTRTAMADAKQPQVFNTATAAAALGLTPRQVGHLAKMHGLGRKLGRDWQFTPAEVRKMKRRPTVGRPKKGAAR
jgi:transcriptional regulator with GAF, ATPase, and Fis domain